jgi:hypothetical protein
LPAETLQLACMGNHDGQTLHFADRHEGHCHSLSSFVQKSLAYGTAEILHQGGWGEGGIGPEADTQNAPPGSARP